jgi:hypothetical protein
MRIELRSSRTESSVLEMGMTRFVLDDCCFADANDRYILLTGGGAAKTAAGEDFSKYFTNRLINMLKGENFVQSLHHRHLKTISFVLKLYRSIQSHRRH